MSKRKTTYSILIVCEGTNTEPNYFKGIKEEIITDTKLWPEGLSMDIRPKPPLEEDNDDDQVLTSPHKSPRKRRKLKPTAPILESEIEEIYRAYPTRFVREAQLGLEDGTYDEAWAVFDKNGHPNHKEAFKLAETEINGKRVGIAFSSISFEHWILLHFEKNSGAFLKSQCKENENRRKVIPCGKRFHGEDCYGKSCIVGYINIKGYLSEYSKKSQIDIYSLLRDKTTTAIENASWLRVVNPGTPIFRLNPYTSVDLLIKHLLKIECNRLWVTFGISINHNGLLISFNRANNVTMKFSVLNENQIRQIFNGNLTFYYHKEVKKGVSLRFGIMNPNESIERQIAIVSAIAGIPFTSAQLDLGDHKIVNILL